MRELPPIVLVAAVVALLGTTTAHAGEPDKPAVAVVDLRIWQATSDARALYLSARPGGDNWGGTVRLPMTDETPSGSYRFTDHTLAVPVEGGTANVDVRVWQHTGDPLRVFLTVRPSGGTWGETEPLEMDEELPTRTYRYSDRIVQVPLLVAAPPATEPGGGGGPLASWEEIDTLIDAAGLEWQSTLGQLNALVDEWSAFPTPVTGPWPQLADLARRARELAEAKRDQLITLRSLPGAQQPEASRFLETGGNRQPL